MARLSKFLLLFVAIVALPGGCLSEPIHKRDRTSPLIIMPLDNPAENLRDLGAGLTWQAGWELASKHYAFGGFSSLIARGDGALVAISDRTRFMEFIPEDHAANPARFSRRYPPKQEELRAIDLEAAYEDAESGTLWAAFENRNLVMRFDRAGNVTGWRAPEEMRDWSSNGGPEAMTRLESGEFVVFSERARNIFSSWHDVLVFDEDPVDRAGTETLHIAMPDGFQPVDVGQLPDGRLMILLRKLKIGFPPRFKSAILFGRLGRNGEEWVWKRTDMVHLHEPIPPENYEGLAICPTKNGGADIWIISDNNMSVFQRTFLIKLGWQPD